MEGQNILYGNKDDLKAIYAAVQTQTALRNDIAACNVEKQRIEKEIVAEEKFLNDTIEATVKKRREQVVSNFDKELSKTQDRLKKVKSERTKAKSKGMESRIKIETAELVQENKNLHEEIRTVFKQKGVPTILDRGWFYSLYFPKSLREKLGFALGAFLIIVGIPSFATWFLGSNKLIKTLLYIFFMAIFTALYVLGYRYARIQKKDVFADTKVQRITILKNTAKIRRIVKSIKKDNDEERYDLNGYDKDIKELEEHINDIVKRKNEAISDFEKTTKQDIEDEITKRDIGRIDKIKSELTELSIKLKELEERQKDVTLSISTNYAAYLGEENLAAERIEKMLVLLDDGKAVTISDAINILNTPVI